MALVRFQVVLLIMSLSFGVQAIGDEPSTFTQETSPSGPAYPSANPGTTSSSPATTPLPVITASDSSEHRKPFIVTAILREGYDDNIFTSKTNKVDSFTTSISPSLLLDLPSNDGDLSMRYTFNAVYFENRPGNQLDTSHQFLARYTHDFSERFKIDLREQFLYYTEPSLFSGTGTVFRDGGYIDNTISAELSSQWTPLFGTVTNYTNNILRYDDSSVATEQDNVEHKGTQQFLFAIVPKINLVFEGVLDHIDYDDVTRGYTSYTGMTGVFWQALPSLNFGALVGASYVDSQINTSEVVPTATVTADWQLGKRSKLSFAYSHITTPTDVIYASGQISDRFTANFSYDITPDFTARAQVYYNLGEYQTFLIQPGTISAFSESDFATALSLGYHVNRYCDLDLGYTFSDVSSDLGFRDYTRNQIYVGIRGTY